MSERVTPDDIDRLAIASWRLGKRAMADVLRITPANSVVKGEIALDKATILEPSFLILHQYPDSLEVLPREITLTINESQTHPSDPNFTVYTQQSLVIRDLGRKASWSLLRDLIIMDSGNQKIGRAHV